LAIVEKAAGPDNPNAYQPSVSPGFPQWREGDEGVEACLDAADAAFE